MSPRDAFAGGHESDPLVATFSLAGNWFGLNALDVQEVLRSQPMTGVPGAAEGIEGLINLRGQVVLAYDLRHGLGLPRRGPDEKVMMMVLGSGVEPIGLLVDRIGDVIGVPAPSVLPPPETLEGALQGVVSGIHQMGSDLLLILDTGSVIERVLQPASGPDDDELSDPGPVRP